MRDHRMRGTLSHHRKERMISRNTIVASMATFLPTLAVSGYIAGTATDGFA
jgi:hypothetical protein